MAWWPNTPSPWDREWHLEKIWNVALRFFFFDFFFWFFLLNVNIKQLFSHGYSAYWLPSYESKCCKVPSCCGSFAACDITSVIHSELVYFIFFIFQFWRCLVMRMFLVMGCGWEVLNLLIHMTLVYF